MPTALRNSLIVSFLAAACGGAWMAWDAFEDHLAEVRKGSIRHLDTNPNRTTATNGWFTAQVPGANDADMIEEDEKVAPARFDQQDNSSSQDQALFSERLKVSELFAECHSAREAKYYYRQFTQEPFDGVRKYELLYKAVGYWGRIFRGAEFGMTEPQVRLLLATQARAAIPEWKRGIDLNPDDPVGNIERYRKISQAYWYAVHSTGNPYGHEENGIGIDEEKLYHLQSALKAPAVQQQLREFKAFSANALQPDSADMKRYLELYNKLWDLNPFRKDLVFWDGKTPMTERPEYINMLRDVTGMTVDQARDFFRHAETLDQLDKDRSAFRDLERRQQENEKDEATKLSEAHEELRQCQYQPR